MDNAQNKSKKFAHGIALVTVAIWGLTFISTKILLQDFAPVEILFCRFLLGFIALCFMRRHILKMKERWHHLLFAAAGLTGVCLYFLLENSALQYCTASNISVTVSTAPMFIAIVSSLIHRRWTFSSTFVLGFFLAIFGIALTSFADASTTQVGFGDLLAILAAFIWAIYSNIINKLAEYGYESIEITKRCFAWGLIFILICMPFAGARLEFTRFLDPVNIANLLFLGLAASAACFAMWSYAVQNLGPTRCGPYIYLSPAVSVTAGVLILGEPLTLKVAAGIVLVLAGLILSEFKPRSKPALKA